MGLKGKFFHSFDENGELEWQGEVIEQLEDGYYLVKTFEWLAGSEHACYVVHISEMKKWYFYEDAQWMKNMYEGTLKHKHPKTEK